MIIVAESTHFFVGYITVYVFLRGKHNGWVRIPQNRHERWHDSESLMRQGGKHVRSRRQFFVAHRPGLHIPCPRNKDMEAVRSCILLISDDFSFFKAMLEPLQFGTFNCVPQKIRKVQEWKTNQKNAQRKHHSPKKNINTLTVSCGKCWANEAHREKKDHRPSQRVIGWMLWAVFPMLGVGLKGLPRVVFFDYWFSIVMLTLPGN